MLQSGGCGVLFLVLAASLLWAAEFEAPPAPYQTCARPANGEMVSANPPCFVYPCKKQHESYVIEASTDAAFPADATMRFTSPYMLFAPGRAFAPGAYHWRWRPGRPEDGAAEWSEVRSFTVPEDAPVVPFPDINALAKRMGTSRPRVQVTAAELPAMRRRAVELFGKDWLNRVERYAEQKREKPLLPEPAFLPNRKDPRRRELYQKTFRTTRPFFGGMARLAQDYLLTGNELSGQEAKRRLLHIVSWDPRGSTCLSHNDEPATEVVRYCPTVLDRVHSLLTDEEKRRCVECLMIRMQEMRDRWKRRPFEKHPYESHNMGYYLPDMTQACLAMAGDAPVEEMLRYTMLQLWSPFYPPFGGADGGWCEGPSYGGWSGVVFARTYLLVERATGVPVQRRSNLRNFWRFFLYGNPPHFKMSPFGDGHEGPARAGHIMSVLAAQYENPYAKWYTVHRKPHLADLDRLLFDDRDVEPKPPYDLPQGHAFFDIGLAAMHSVLPDGHNNVAVLMRSCPFGSISHAYADQNTFVLHAYGEPLIIPSGYYQLYAHPHHAQWTWQTKASNSVLVNGEGQTPRSWNAKGYLRAFETTAAGDRAVGDAKQAYPSRLDRFDRQIVFLRPVHTGGEPIVVIRDDLAAPKPATYQFLLHALNKMSVDPAAQQVTIAKDDAACRVDYLAPKGLTFDQHDQFTKPPIRGGPNQWHLTASTREPQATAESLIVIQPYRTDETDGLLSTRMERGEGCIGTVLSKGDRSVIVLFRTDSSADTIAFGKVRTDAQAASVRMTGDEVRSAVFYGGTMLSYGEQTLLELENGKPGAVSASLAGTRCLVSSPQGGRVSPRLAGPKGFVETEGSWARAISEKPVPAPKPMQVEEQGPVPFEVARHEHVQHVVARASLPTAVHHEVELTVGNPGAGPLPVWVTAEGSFVRRVLRPGQAEERFVLPAMCLGGNRDFTVTADEALGGRLAILNATARRVYGQNLLPNGSFEEVADGQPVGWRAASISKGTQARIDSADGGRNGGRCLKVTCTEAPGGTFGATLRWPGVQPSTMDRKFRMSCWVKTDATSRAGFQVTSANWKWYKITKKLQGRTDWGETSLEFSLPAGENITHARLHMNAEHTGTELFVDDVRLEELRM